MKDKIDIDGLIDVCW